MRDSGEQTVAMIRFHLLPTIFVLLYPLLYTCPTSWVCKKGSVEYMKDRKKGYRSEGKRAKDRRYLRS